LHELAEAEEVAELLLELGELLPEVEEVEELLLETSVLQDLLRLE
jgi:hypothetical protein